MKFRFSFLISLLLLLAAGCGQPAAPTPASTGAVPTPSAAPVFQAKPGALPAGAIEQSPGRPEQSPDSTGQSPDSVEQSPDSVEKSPDNVKESPDSTEQTSDSVDESPDSVEQSPDSPEPSPDSVEKSPDSVEKSPDSTEQTAGAPDPNAVLVEAAQEAHPISPYIYGMSGPPPEYVQDLRITLNSWGGNPATRYNWQLGNAWNAARDWEYRNGDYGYKSGSVSDDFVRENMAAGIASRIALPTIGWVAKDTSSCSFPKSDGSCGTAGGARCDKPGPIADPYQTSIEAPPEFTAAWVEHLINKMNFEVQFFALDNEPDIWGATHYDVHPTCTTYDEIAERFVMYAAPVKEIAPESEILGPVSCCWWYYWNSMAGEADKRAHGGMDFLPWFLQQMADYETQTGQRLLDVLDIHYYPEGFYNDDDSSPTAAGRLRSTRSLWDPTFVDESWIDEPVYLIPRIMELIDTYYPGARLGISEWNFGADETMNGAIAIADVLGIFGREGLYLASYWRYPEQFSPGYYAFKMYTNYDGQGGRFGDASVQAVSQLEAVGAYAALDSATGNLHLMLTNRDPDQEMTVPVRPSGFSPAAVALYRYNSDNTGHIVSSTVAAGPEFSVTLPPYSISLLVMEPAQ